MALHARSNAVTFDYRSPPQMKLTVLSPTLRVIGGLEWYVLNQISSLRDRGHTVHVITSEAAQADSGPPNILRSPALFDPSLRPARLIATAKAARALKAELSIDPPDCIIAHNLDVTITQVLLSSIAPVLVFVHTAVLDCPAGTRWLKTSNRACIEPGGLRCLREDTHESCLGVAAGTMPLHHALRRIGGLELVKRDLNRASGVATVSEYARARLTQLMDDPTKVSVVPPPIHKVATPKIQQIKGRVLFAGRLFPFKGVDHAIRAIAATPNARLVIAGEGPERDGLTRLAVDLGIADRVEMLGWLSSEELAKEIERCSVLVVPSLWPEYFGIVGPSALAHGRPVVAYDVGGINEWLSSKCGVLVEAGKEHALRAAIARLVNDPDEASRLGENGKEVATQFSPENFAQSTEAAIVRAGEVFRNSHRRQSVR